MTESRGERVKDAAHLPALDGLRALSILAVLACHMLPLGPAEWKGNATAGYMGMSVFFALSGFLITRFLWDTDDIGQFFVRRIARIVPLVLIVSILYGLFLEGRPDTVLAINLYVLNYWHEAIVPSVSPLWSLSIEMQFYIVIGLSVLAFKRRGFWVIPLAALTVTLLRISTGTFGSIVTHLRVDEILAGSLLALFWLHRDQGQVKRVWTYLPKLFWVLLVLWALACWPPSSAWGYLRPYLSALLIGSVLAMNGGWQTSVLSWGSLRYVAAISFALYVWHSPFRHGWFDEGSGFEVYLIKRPIAFVCIFALAHLSTYYLEKPLIKVAKNWGKAKNH
ncbi:MAG: acyltransferase [Pseudomonadota bacterium]